MISKIKFILQESVRGFFYAWTPAILSCVTIGISLIVISISFYSYMLFLNYSDSFTNNYEINIFFDQEISLSSSKEAYDFILKDKAILSGEFIDKEESAKKFKEYFDDEIQNLLGENPLPYSGQFLIKQNYRNPDSLMTIAESFKEIEGVESVQYDKAILIRIHKILDKIMTAFSVIGFGIVFVSVILVSNTTRLMIHSKRESISILSLMGATNFFIRIPFLIEGVLQGLMGALISILLLLSLVNLLEYIFDPFLLIFNSSFEFVILFNVALGILLGLIGSKRAIAKYLP